MQVIQARVDGQVFVLTAGTDLEALKAQILNAVRAGEDFVEFDTLGRELLSVLITSSIPVRFEVVERSQQQIDEWEEHPPSIDGLVPVETFLSDLDH